MSSPSKAAAAVWAVMLGGFLVAASGCGPVAAEGGQGYIVLDAAAREAGLAVLTSGETRAEALPIAVAPEALTTLVGEGRRDRLDIAPGETLHIWGSNGFVNRGVADRDELRVRGGEGAARELAERLGAEVLPSWADDWILRGRDVLVTAALMDDEVPGITAVEPVYVEPGEIHLAYEARDDIDPVDQARLGIEDPARYREGRAQAQRMAHELEVTVELSSKGRTVFEVGEPIPVRAVLGNRAWGTRWVVKPGDGSSMGWREPHVFYTAEREERHGVWVEVPRREYRRCGVYDHRWDFDVVPLQPGASLDLDEVISPERALDLDAPGRIRIFAHYHYRAGSHDFRPGVRVPRPLRGVPEYEVVSAPLELRIARPSSPPPAR